MMTQKQREVRNLSVQFEARATDENARILEGHAAVFDTPAEIGGWFIEEIARGAFVETIQQDDIRALLNHDSNYVLGRNRSGTLELEEDEIGLFVRIHLPDTQIGRDTYESVKRGDISQMSFMFEAVKVEWSRDEEEKKEYRKVLEAKLYDVSPVTFAAYEETDISARGCRSAESILKDYQERGQDAAKKTAEREQARVRMAHRKRQLEIMSKET